MSGVRVEVTRGGRVESAHEVSVAVTDAAGRLRASAGATDEPVYARSALKPLQAVPVVTDGAYARFGLTEQELALCCASHSGEPRHVATARTMLRKIGVEEEALVCGPHPPYHRPTAKALAQHGYEPTRAHNNCSGKHAGMMALARVHGWPIAGYHRPEHPVQRRLLEEVANWSEVRAGRIATATDGCGVVTFGLPLRALAHSFAKLAAAGRKPAREAKQEATSAVAGDGASRETAARGVVQAMLRHPWYVGGTERLCTELMRVTGGRIVAKYGAEGVYCAGAPGAELGIALKVRDGARRAVEPALVEVLRALGLLMEDEYEQLEGFARPGVRNTLGEVVGGVRARVQFAAGDDG